MITKQTHDNDYILNFGLNYNKEKKYCKEINSCDTRGLYLHVLSNLVNNWSLFYLMSKRNYMVIIIALELKNLFHVLMIEKMLYRLNLIKAFTFGRYPRCWRGKPCKTYPPFLSTVFTMRRFAKIQIVQLQQF